MLDQDLNIITRDKQKNALDWKKTCMQHISITRLDIDADTELFFQAAENL